MKTFVVTGCSEKNNLGYMIVKEIESKIGNCHVIAICASGSSFLKAKPDLIDELYVCDLSNEFDIEIVCNIIKDSNEKIDVLINCAGMNTNEWFEESTNKKFDELMSINGRAIYQMTRELLDKISNANGTVLNIVSNASHIPMRCSLAYNASKAAAKMITKQMAHELTKKFGITVFSISPNKLDGTDMSKFVDRKIPELRGWTENFSKEYQANALVTGKETNPQVLAEFIVFLLSTKERHFFLSGCDIEYGA